MKYTRRMALARRADRLAVLAAGAFAGYLLGSGYSRGWLTATLAVVLIALSAAEVFLRPVPGLSAEQALAGLVISYRLALYQHDYTAGQIADIGATGIVQFACPPVAAPDIDTGGGA